MPKPEADNDLRCISADIDGDGQDELAVILTDPKGSLGPEMRGDVAIFDQQGVRFVVAASLTKMLPKREMAQMVSPAILAVQDVNNDGAPDLLVTSTVCGAHTCVTDVYIISWNGHQYVDLTQGNISMPTARVFLEDRDSGGILELVLEGGTIGSAGAGPQRSRTEVYRWTGSRYELAQMTFAPSPYLYFKIADGNEAFAAGDLLGAIDIYRQAIASPDLRSWKEEVGMSNLNEKKELLAFARFRIGLAFMKMANLEYALPSLQEAATADPTALHARAAQEFLKAYTSAHERSGDINLAYQEGCREVTRYVHDNAQAFGSFWDYGYANPPFEEALICPP